MKRDGNAGYSLIEVLIAIAITAVVLLSVVTLFYMGRRNVYSGKQMTYAVSVGTRMLEDLSPLSADDMIAAFNINDNTTRGDVTVQGVTYHNSATRNSSSCTSSGSPPVWTCTNDTGGYLASWTGLIDPSKLSNARLGIILTPRAPMDGTKPWTSAQFTKARVYIQWDEAQNRRRIAFFDTTKVDRQ